MRQEERGRAFVMGIFVVLLALFSMMPEALRAGPVSTPPVVVRSFTGTATDTATLVTIESTTGQKVGGTASVLVINDDAAGGQDIWVNFNGTAADPGSTFTASNSFTVKPGEKINIDGQFLRVSVVCAVAGQTAPTRFICSY